MAWYDTQGSSDTITTTEWNNMVTWIRQQSITAQTATTLTLNLTHHTIVCDTTSNVIALTLPEAADSKGKEYIVFLETDGGNDVTVTCAGSDTLDGSNTIGTLADAEDFFHIKAVSDDRWLIITNNGVALS